MWDQATGVVKCIAVPDGARIKNSALKAKGDIYEAAVGAGASSLAFARVVKAADGSLELDCAKQVPLCARCALRFWCS